MIKRRKPTDMRQRLLKEKFCKLAKKSLEGRSEKISQPMCVKDRSKKNFWKLEKKSVEDRSKKISQPIFVKGCSKKKFASWRSSPSKIAPRKFPNRCSSKVAQRKIWKLAKKSVEDRSKKISQPMFVKDCSKKKFESWRRSPLKIAPRKFPNRCSSKIAQSKIWKLEKKSVEDRSKKPMCVKDCSKKKFASWRRSPSKIAPSKISQPMCVEDLERLQSKKNFGNSWRSWSPAGGGNLSQNLIPSIVLPVQ